MLDLQTIRIWSIAKKRDEIGSSLATILRKPWTHTALHSDFWWMHSYDFPSVTKSVYL